MSTCFVRCFTAPSKPTRRNLDPTPHVVWLQGAVSREACLIARAAVHHAHIVGGLGGGEARQMIGRVGLRSGRGRRRAVIGTCWPATSIDGDPGIVSGMLSVSRTVGGEFLFNLSVGLPGGAPENFTYLEFPLSSGQALAQGRL
jgi:hypothetical protein